MREDLPSLEAGAVNLVAHVENVKKFGVPVVVAINRFSTDTDAEIDRVIAVAKAAGAFRCEVSEMFTSGGAGGLSLGRAVMAACQEPKQFRYLYDLDEPLERKLEILARDIYGADGIDMTPAARRSAERFAELGFGKLPVCVAKTQYSLSHDPKRLGRPRGYRFPVRELRLSAGAGFVYALAGDISTMPGLPSNPAARRIGVDAQGNITGLS
jgi:formyltetrahydrofolate synthetase